MTLITRQVAAATAQPPTTMHYDHRWLLFLIPICLLFIALLFIVWYIVRRRKKQRQRRSILRNRALVIAEQEKQREREEKRLSRGNSLSSRLSRMTSVKSTATRTRSTRSTKPTSMNTALDVKDDDPGSMPSNSNEILDEKQGQGSSEIRDNVADVDVEYLAETCALPIIPANSEASSRVRIVEEVKPFRVKRKEVAAAAVTGEVLMRDSGSGSLHRGESISSSNNNNWDVHRQDSQKSIGNVASSSSHGTQGSGSNPFASPSTSSAGHEKLVVPQGAEVSSKSSNEGGGLARKFSGIARLRQPSPAAGLYRSDSRASRRSSTRSVRRTDVQSPVSPASLAAANWTYVPQAAKWKAPSSDESTASPIGEEKEEPNKTSVDASLSPPVGQLSRRPSTGVAGSKFVESFDEE